MRSHQLHGYQLYIDSTCSQIMRPNYDQIMVDRTLKMLAINAINIDVREKIIGCGNISLMQDDVVCINYTSDEKDSLSKIKRSQTHFSIISLHFELITANCEMIFSSDVFINILKNLRINEYCSLFSCSKNLYQLRHELEQHHQSIPHAIAKLSKNYHPSDNEGIIIKLNRGNCKFALTLNEKMQLDVAEIDIIDPNKCFFCRKLINCKNYILKSNLETTLENRFIPCVPDSCNYEILEKNDIYSLNVCDDCKCYNIPKFDYAKATCPLMKLRISLFFTFHIKEVKESYFRECYYNFFKSKYIGDIEYQVHYANCSFENLKLELNSYIWYDVVRAAKHLSFCPHIDCEDYSYEHLQCIHFEVKHCPKKNLCKNIDSYHREYFYHPE